MNTDRKSRLLRTSLAQALREWSKVDSSAVPFVAPYESAHKDVVPVPEANIATYLGPKLDGVLKRGSRLRVVGYDGAALAKVGYPWRRKLGKWLGNGCDVDYLIQKPTAKVIEALRGLVQRLPEGAGNLRVFQPRRTAQLPRRLQSTLAEWKTFHFAVSEKPPTLWIEANHKTSEPKAFDCYFFPETAATETGLADDYQRRFDYMAVNGCDMVTLSQNAKVGKKKPATC